ncbi:MAG: bifunctional sugar phosphate isomerase/epimerase/4-hydroxyphenylpyruvate dioxygenase family protein [Planktomarina sp.]
MLCIPTSIVPGTLQEKLTAIAKAGFDGIDLGFTDIAQFDGTLAALRDLVTDHGLGIVGLGPLQGDVTRAKVAAKLKVADAVGAQVLLVDLPQEINVLPDSPHNCQIALRPSIAVEPFVISLLSGADSKVGLGLQTRTALADGSRPARLRDWPAERVFHVQMVDGHRRPLLPGQGTLNIGGAARVLARGGYAGPWSVGAETQGKDTVRSAYRAVVNVLGDAAATEPKLARSVPAVPGKVASTGIEFVEFAVDAADAETLEFVLASMAFRKERQHIHKDVVLWRQGAVNMVVNRERSGHAGAAFDAHGPTVCDMGLRVQDAAATVARAKALGSQDFTQTVQLGDLDIPAIRGVGGHVIHFIDEKSDLHRVWDIEFQAVSDRVIQPAGLRRIDHLAQTMRYDEMQGWLLYYLSTFNMSKSPIFDVADPSGVVRSQSVETPEGEVRLNLNGAADGDTFAGSFVSGKTGAGIQHIAFATDDIFETSARLALNGFERLNIPQNYYAETQDEFGLSDTFTEQLRAENILYDEDDTGAYFQLYGKSIFNGFFFEIVQRKGRYAGYGARNAAIRLAAQT